MDWISGVQRAIDYVEDHIREPIDYEEVAKRAYSSSFHFQRVFSILCGFTLGEYIRCRRLSLAGSEVLSTDDKVIDIALRYGYDSPESFSRAFSRFHGMSPSQAKGSKAVLKSFSRLSVKLILNGGNMMDYRIETKKAFKLVMKRKRVSGKQELTAAEISEFWQQCSTDGTIQALCKYIPEDNIFKDCIVGASFGQDASDKEFPYAIGAMYDGRPVEEADFIVEEIPAHTYVVFPCTGKMPEAFQKLYQQIYSEFFPASEYQPCGGTDFEAYPSADVTSPDYHCEIWVAVEKK
ncbi:AraC family transcriptional regulator [Lacrimispora sp. NSJ-141]|uniref:AraC family transcriptional regulator n=1 Tax=Lientehia hominis TaxID=2897778 RepID=A0AAP2W841_9FIRM|nr:AraC family transcriptional regulator [Lientehia hominis]MCD2491740.1 AraC family transcriptional regulator [Lientehia hominis]